MVHVGPREISKEDYDKANKSGVSSLISESILYGYGFYGGRVFTKEGNNGEVKYYLEFDRGDSCD